MIDRRAPEPAERELLEAYAAGLEAYRKGDFEAARGHLTAAQRSRAGGDPASALLLERIRTLQAEPPPEWSGVWTFETK